MISLSDFMGGGRQRATGGTYNTAWGDGRVLYHEPTATLTLNLPDPDDVEIGAGWPHLIVLNMGSSGFDINVQTSPATAVAQDEAGFVYITFDSGGARVWRCGVFPILTS